MNVKKAIKKVVALGVGVSMLGATLLGATAYDLASYPSPFVQDGVFNGLMVVGDDAAPADIIGVTDIAMSLQYSSTVKETIKVSGDTGVSLGGDSVKFQRSGDVLELNEYLGQVVETMDSSDAEALKSFTVSNDKGTTDVNQYLRWNWGTAGFTSDSDVADTSVAKPLYTKDDDDNVGDFLWFKDGEEAFQYEMEFVEGFESDIDSNNDLTDLEDETLHILGEDFAVLSAKWSTTSGVTLNLMGGAIHDTIEEGETKTYTLKGKEYEVTALIISDWSGANGDAKVKMKINGEVTKEMSEGDTEILNDGTTMGIREVLPNEAGETAGGDILEFYLGAYKIQFQDKYTSAFDGNTEVNEENIEDSDLQIQYTNTSDTVKINKITYRLFTDGVSGDEPYLAPGQGYREKLDEPEGMLADSWDVRYEGLSDPGTSMIKVKSSGDDEYRLSFTNNQGIDYSNVRYLYTNTTTGVYFGDDDDLLQFDMALPALDLGNVSANCIRKNDYAVLTHNGDQDTGITRIVRFDSVDEDNALVQLTDVGSGATINAQYTALNVSTQNDDVINVGGYSFNFAIWEVAPTLTGKDEYRLCIDLDDSNAIIGDHHANVVVDGGGIVDLSTANQSGIAYRAAVTDDVQLTVTTPADNFDEASTPEIIYVNLSESSSTADELDLDVLDSLTTGLDMNTPEDNDNLNEGLSNYGVFVKQLTEDNGPDTLEMDYPLAQVLPQAFVLFSKTVTVEGGAGTVTVEKPQRIEIGSAVLASQVSDPTAVNVISVGGSCINSVTAEIMGLSYPACGTDSGLAEGEGIVKAYENGDNVALVVAGWEAEDTTRATRVLADYKTYQEGGQLVGSEVKVTGTSATEFTVTPVSGMTGDSTEA